jgi:hypothetical protein
LKLFLVSVNVLGASNFTHSCFVWPITERRVTVNRVLLFDLQ